MTSNNKLRLLALATSLALGLGAAHATDITGAGSSFVYPVISKWSAAYAEKTGNRVNYQSIGSGGGIAQAPATCRWTKPRSPSSAWANVPT